MARGQRVEAEIAFRANLAEFLAELKTGFRDLQASIGRDVSLAPMETQLRTTIGVMDELKRKADKMYLDSANHQKKLIAEIQATQREAAKNTLRVLEKRGQMYGSRREVGADLRLAYGPDQPTSLGREKQVLAVERVTTAMGKSAAAVGREREALEELRGQLRVTSSDLVRYGKLVADVGTITTQSLQRVDAAIMLNAKSWDWLEKKTTASSMGSTKVLEKATADTARSIKILTAAASDGSIKTTSALDRIIEKLRKLAEAETVAAQAAEYGAVRRVRAGTAVAKAMAIVENTPLTTRNLQSTIERRSMDSWRAAQQTRVWGYQKSADTTFGKIAHATGYGGVFEAGMEADAVQALNQLKREKGLLEYRMAQMLAKSPNATKVSGGKYQQSQILAEGLTGRINNYESTLDKLRVGRANQFLGQGAGDIRQGYLGAKQEVSLQHAQGRVASDAQLSQLGEHYARLGSYIEEQESRLNNKKVKMSRAERAEVQKGLAQLRTLRNQEELEMVTMAHRNAGLLEREAKEEENRLTQIARKGIADRKAMRQQDAINFARQLHGNAGSIAGLDAEGLANARHAITTAGRLHGAGGIDGDPMQEFDAATTAGLMTQVKAREKTMGLNAPSRWAKGVNFVTGLKLGSGNWSAYGGANRGLFHVASHKITNVSQMMGTSLYGMGAIGAVTAITKGTIGIATKIQAAEMAMAGMIHSYGQFVDLEGKALKPADQLNKSLEYSKVLYNDIRETAAKSLVTQSELQEGFLSGAPQLISKGFTDTQSLNITNQVMQLGKLQGLTSTAIMSDLRDFATGNINVRSQVLRAAGMKKEDLKAAYDTGGAEGAYKYFLDKMKGFAEVFKNLQNTPIGMLNRFSVELQKLGQTFGEVLVPIILPQLVKFQDMLKGWADSGAMAKFAKSFGEAVGGFIENSAKFLAWLSPFLSNMSNLLLIGVAGMLGAFAAKMALTSLAMGPPIVGFLAALGAIVTGIIALKKRADDEAYSNLETLTTPYSEMEKGAAKSKVTSYIENQLRDTGLIKRPDTINQWNAQSGKYNEITPLLTMWKETGLSKEVGHGLLDVQGMTDYLSPRAFQTSTLQAMMNSKEANLDTGFWPSTLVPIVKWLKANKMSVAEFQSQVRKLEKIYPTANDNTVTIPLAHGRDFVEGDFDAIAAQAQGIQQDVAKNMYEELKKKGKAPALKNQFVGPGISAPDYVATMMTSPFAQQFKERSADAFRRKNSGLVLNPVEQDTTADKGKKIGTVNSAALGPTLTPVEAALQTYAEYQRGQIQSRINQTPMLAEQGGRFLQYELGSQALNADVSASLAKWRSDVLKAAQEGKGPNEFTKINIEFQKNLEDSMSAFMEHTKQVREAIEVQKQSIEISKAQLVIDQRELDLSDKNIELSKQDLTTVEGRNRARQLTAEITAGKIENAKAMAAIDVSQSITNPAALEAIRNASNSTVGGWINDPTVGALLGGNISGVTSGDMSAFWLLSALAGNTSRVLTPEAASLKQATKQAAINLKAEATGKIAGKAVPQGPSVPTGSLSSKISGGLSGIQQRIKQWGDNFKSAFPGTRYEQFGPGSISASLHPTGQALDLFGKDKSAYVQWAMQNGAKYIIYNRQQWSKSTGKWTAYHGPDPHTSHVHVDWKGDPNAGGGGGMYGGGDGVPGFDSAKMSNKISGMFPGAVAIPNYGSEAVPPSVLEQRALLKQSLGLKLTAEEKSAIEDGRQKLLSYNQASIQSYGEYNQFKSNQLLGGLSLFDVKDTVDNGSLYSAQDATYLAGIKYSQKTGELAQALGSPEGIAAFAKTNKFDLIAGESTEDTSKRFTDLLFSDLSKARIAEKWAEILVGLEQEIVQTKAAESIAKKSFEQDRWMQGFDRQFSGMTGDIPTTGMNPQADWVEQMNYQRGHIMSNTQREVEALKAKEATTKVILPGGIVTTLSRLRPAGYYEDLQNGLVRERLGALSTGSGTSMLSRNMRELTGAFHGAGAGFLSQAMNNPLGLLNGKERLDWGLIQPLQEWAKGINDRTGFEMLTGAMSGKFTSEQLLADPRFNMKDTHGNYRYLKSDGHGGYVLDRAKAARAAMGNMAGSIAGTLGGQMLGQGLFPHKDPGVIGMGSSLGTSIGMAGGLGFLGIAAGPWGAVAGGLIGGLLGGLFGGSKRDPNEERRKELEKQHQQRMVELLSRIDKSLRPQADYFRTIKGDVLYGTASRWYSGRAYAQLGLQGAIGGR